MRSQTGASPDTPGARTVPPSLAVVEAVAREEGIDPIELTPTLNSVVDPDALDALFSPTDAESLRSCRVEFEYHGYRVTISGTGDIRVSASDRPS